jgi:hypothetical protein
MSKSAAIVKDNRIINVISISDDSDPEDVGALPLPEGKWIGDEYHDIPDMPEPQEKTPIDDLIDGMFDALFGGAIDEYNG